MNPRYDVIGTAARHHSPPFRHPVVATVLFGVGMFGLGTLIYFLASPSPARFDAPSIIFQTVLTALLMWRFLFSPKAKAFART